MGSAAVAISAIAVGIWHTFVGVGDGFGVAARKFSETSSEITGADGVRDPRQGGYMAKTRLKLDQVFRIKA
jgi:hypothetical protein